LTPLGGPVEEDDLHARIDGQLLRERAEDVEAYRAAHPEEQKRFAQYAAQREALRSAFSSQAYGPIPNRLPGAASHFSHQKAGPASIGT